MLFETYAIIILLVVGNVLSDTVPSKYEVEITEEAFNSIDSLNYLLNESVKRFMKNAFYGNLSEMAGNNVTKRHVIINKMKANLKNTMYCQSCIFAYNMLAFWKKNLKLNDDTITSNIAVIFGILKAQYPITMVLSLVDINLSTVLKIIDDTNLIGSIVCGTVLQFYDCAGTLGNTWKVDIPEERNILTANNEMKVEKAKDLKIMHITDIHYDPNYSSDANANCKMALCCQKGDEIVTNIKDRAGYWSDYRCDIPGKFIEASFKAIKDKHGDIDVIYFTGDCVCHSLTDSSVEKVKNDLKFVIRLFKKYFPNAAIYPVLGNHDVHPTNLFAPSKLKNTEHSTQWLYDYIHELWKEVLPKNTSFETIKRGGFYTSKEENRPRIIGLNSNVGYTLNFWILYEDGDFYRQLQWFADTLQKAEDAGEIVHVLSHVPSGNCDVYSRWSDQFNEIIKRYSRIIGGIFVGHVHFDEIVVYYNRNDPVGLGFNGGSLTPYVNVNPNYRIYTVDSNTFKIKDFDEYYINITKANAERALKWEKLYSFNEEYGLSELTPKTVHDLVLKMAKNATLRNIYFKNKVRSAEPAIEEGCDQFCELESLCVTVTNSYTNKDMCNYISGLYVR